MILNFMKIIKSLVINFTKKKFNKILKIKMIKNINKKPSGLFSDKNQLIIIRTAKQMLYKQKNNIMLNNLLMIDKVSHKLSTKENKKYFNLIFILKIFFKPKNMIGIL